MQTVDDVAALEIADSYQVSYLTQTTLAADETTEIDDAGDLRPEWLDGVRVVGLTAGASAPPRLVDAVIAALAQLAPVTVIECETTRETVHFTLPAAVRRS
ncbi:MAG: hypothetical protein ACRDRO_06885 [Pseudonocardiaceae bacterium]